MRSTRQGSVHFVDQYLLNLATVDRQNELHAGGLNQNLLVNAMLV